MNPSGTGVHDLRTVSSSKPQVRQSTSRQSVAVSEDFYSLSERTTSPGSASQATIVRYATPDSYPTRRTPSPAKARPHVAPETAMPKKELLRRETGGMNSEESSTHPGEGRLSQISPMSDTRTRRNSSEFTRTASTPGFDDSPHIHFAINQLTRDGDDASLGRRSSLASDDCPAERVAWDEGLGYFIRSSEFSRAAPEQRQQSPERPVQDSVDPESFIPVEPPDESLLYPSLDFVPVVLRPLALTAAILCSLLMVAGIVFCNVWSQQHEGLWGYGGLGGSRYFVFQFLPQILAAIIIIWTFVIQAAVYRTMPFAIMASERPLDRVLQKLPILPRNFVLPDLSHFRSGEPVIGISLFVIWLSNFITIPLLSCLFQAKYYVIDGQGTWRWTSVQAVGWTLVAVYGLLAIGLFILLIRFARAWSGLMWDPVCLADLISVIQRSNILHDFELSEILHDAGEPLGSKVLRLGYWKISNRHDTFYGIGEVNAPVRTPSLHQTRKQRGKQPQGLSKVSFDLERQNVHGKDMLDQQIYSPSARHRWITWFLRKTAVVTWIASAFGLLIAFLLVSFINDAIQNGFPPRLPTLPTAGGFSSSNFLYSFIPSLIGTFLFLFWQPIDVYFRAVQPFATLSDPNGATPEKSLLLSYQSNLPFKVSALALLNGHYKVAWISLMSVFSIAIPILAGGVFIALWHPSHEEIRIASLMPAFYAIIAFCALYAVSSLCIWPGRARHLPHNISTLADLTSFLYQSPLLSDKLLREPRSKTDLVTRLVIAPPGEREHPVYGFGVYVGRDGREHLGIDRFHRPGRADMLITTGW